MSDQSQPKAVVVPFSSVVGSSVSLHAATGQVIGILGIMNVGGTTPEDWKQRSIAVADDTARRINAHDDLVAALKLVRTRSIPAGGAVVRRNDDWRERVTEVLDTIDAALAKAGAQ